MIQEPDSSFLCRNFNTSDDGAATRQLTEWQKSEDESTNWEISRQLIHQDFRKIAQAGAELGIFLVLVYFLSLAAH